MSAVAERYTKWRTIMNEYERSGLTQQQFCKSRDLSLKKFKYYRYHLQQKEKATRSTGTSSTEKQFIPVKVKRPSSANTPGIVMRLPNGIELRLPGDITLSNILKELNGC